MGTIQRICQYIDTKGISKYKFYQKTGLSNGFLDKGENIGSDKCEKIIYAFPEINPDWLLTGKGDMLRDGEATSIAEGENGKSIAVKAEKNKTGTPYYAVDFLAGFDSVFNDLTNIPNSLISFPNIKGAECWVDVSGKSMEPLISPGDVIAIKKVNDWKQNVLYGEVYAIVTEEYRTIKRIRKATVREYITLVPENPEYDAQDILADNVQAVYQVLGCAKKIF